MLLSSNNLYHLFENYLEAKESSGTSSFAYIPDEAYETTFAILMRGIASAQMRLLSGRGNSACPPPCFTAYHFFKRLTILAAHQIVKNRIDSGAEVVQAAAYNVEALVQIRIIIGSLRVDVE